MYASAKRYASALVLMVVAWSLGAGMLWAGMAPVGPDTTFADSPSPQQLDDCIWEEEEQPPGTCPSRLEAYRELLRYAGQDLPEEHQEVLDRHLKQLVLILPDELEERIDALEETPVDSTLGDELLAWWRSQNPLPATRVNDRMEEHLRRVEHALENYRDERHDTGFDVRGETYVRFGPPAFTTSVNQDDPRIISNVLRTPVLMEYDFPENEYWGYPHINEHAFYLFVRQDGRYRIGRTRDLVPRSLRGGLGNSQRGQEKAYYLGVILEEMYAQLATINIEFGHWQQEIAAVRPGPTSLPAGQSGPFALQSVIYRGRAEEENYIRLRERQEPDQHTEVSAEVEELPIAARVARFLDEDGSTRTELYWSVLFSALAGAEDEEAADAYLLSVTKNLKDEAYQDHSTERRRMMVPNPGGLEGILAPQTFTTRNDTGQFHLAVQWDGYEARIHEETGRFRGLGRHLNRHVFRADSLSVLHSEGKVLEMSDLMPYTYSEERELDLDQIRPYPFDRITPEIPLGLYFEIYHLTFGGDDRTHYSVEYEVHRLEREGGLRGLLGQHTETLTTTQTSATGDSRRAQEYINLDLDEWDRTGELAVVVRITDEHTGEQVERTVRFEMREHPEEGEPRAESVDSS